MLLNRRNPITHTTTMSEPTKFLAAHEFREFLTELTKHLLAHQADTHCPTPCDVFTNIDNLITLMWLHGPTRIGDREWLSYEQKTNCFLHLVNELGTHVHPEDVFVVLHDDEYTPLEEHTKEIIEALTKEGFTRMVEVFTLTDPDFEELGLSTGAVDVLRKYISDYTTPPNTYLSYY